MRKAKWICWDAAAPILMVSEILALSPKHAAHEFVACGEWYGSKRIAVVVIRKSLYRSNRSEQAGAMVIEVNRNADLADLADHVFGGEVVETLDGEMWRIQIPALPQPRLISYTTLVELGVLIESLQDNRIPEYIERNSNPSFGQVGNEQPLPQN